MRGNERNQAQESVYANVLRTINVVQGMQMTVRGKHKCINCGHGIYGTHYGEGSNRTRPFFHRGSVKLPSRCQEQDCKCVNPLSWKQRAEKAEKRLHEVCDKFERAEAAWAEIAQNKEAQLKECQSRYVRVTAAIENAEQNEARVRELEKKLAELRDRHNEIIERWEKHSCTKEEGRGEKRGERHG